MSLHQKLIEEECRKISPLLPDVSIAEIQSFMKRLPKIHHGSLSNLRIALTISHFYSLKDNANLIRVRTENIRYANLIHDLFPIHSTSRILRKLQKYGSVSDRPRLVLKNIMKDNQEEINTTLYSLKHKTGDFFGEPIDLCESDSVTEVINLLSPNDTNDCDPSVKNEDPLMDKIDSLLCDDQNTRHDTAISEKPADDNDISLPAETKPEVLYSETLEEQHLCRPSTSEDVYQLENVPFNNLNVNFQQQDCHEHLSSYKINFDSNDIASKTTAESKDVCLNIDHKKELEDDLQMIPHVNGITNAFSNDLSRIFGDQGHRDAADSEKPTNNNDNNYSTEKNPEDQNSKTLEDPYLCRPSTSKGVYQTENHHFNNFRMNFQQQDCLEHFSNYDNIDNSCPIEKKPDVQYSKTLEDPYLCRPSTSKGIYQTENVRPDYLNMNFQQDCHEHFSNYKINFNSNDIVSKGTSENKGAYVISSLGNNVKMFEDIKQDTSAEHVSEIQVPEEAMETSIAGSLLKPLQEQPLKEESQKRSSRLRLDLRIPSDEPLVKKLRIRLNFEEQIPEEPSTVGSSCGPSQNKSPSKGQSLENFENAMEGLELRKRISTGTKHKENKKIVPVENSDRYSAIELTSEENKLVYKLMEVFPDADPNFIRNAITIHKHLEPAIEYMLTSNYKKREVVQEEEKELDVNEQFSFAKELLPDIDPDYLTMKLSDLKKEEISEFISEALERKNYPTLKEYNRKQQLSAQKRQYTSEFSVEKFVKLVPDPVATFTNPNRPKPSQEDIYFINRALRNKFDRVPVKVIEKEIAVNNFKPFASAVAIRKTESLNKLKTRRMKYDINTINCENIPLIQEVTYILHEDEINGFIKKKSEEKEMRRVQMKTQGLTKTCCCCFDDEVMPEDAYCCTNQCIICHQCVVRSTEVSFGEGKVDFQCLGDCGINLDLNTLQGILPPNLFSKIAQKKAVMEVKAAGIENLEFCPFCDFATIPPGPPEEFKIFSCQNPDCLKETCRLCKERSHIPLKCDEVETDVDVKKRVFIENKMTEALLRQCFRCGMKFFKEEGCNKMTCTCGALMCYVCGKPVENYKHFNGLGGDKTERCPLYSDTLKLNRMSVVNAAMEAKKEIGVAGPSSLKVDPTADIDIYFKDRAKKLPREPHMAVLDRQRDDGMRPLLVRRRGDEMRRQLERQRDDAMRRLFDLMIQENRERR